MTPTHSCLDGETLAAWIEGGLNRADAALAEAHVSSCPRCQEIAGLIVKTTPVTGVVAPWWRRRAAWLVPVAAGVAAAGLLIIAPTDPAPGPVPAGPEATLQRARNDTTAAAPPGARVAPAAEPKATQTRPAETKKEGQRDERANREVAAAPAAVPSAATAPPGVASRGPDEQAARQGFAKVADKHAVSPDGTLHWRITDRGALERSTDGGTTWQAMNVGVPVTFSTVQAPQPRTALVTTTDGRVFRTADGGATWQLVPR